MPTLEEAKEAKQSLQKQLGRPWWLRGVGISQDAQGYFVKINVSNLENSIVRKANLPIDINGVRVVVDSVGDIRAL